ncbi:MAG: tetratricopeptide repeat protein [Sumerlaeia bacterium]
MTVALETWHEHYESAELAVKRKAFDAAENAARRCVRLAEEAADEPGRRRLASSLLLLAKAEQGRGRAEAALDATQRALELLRRILPPDHRDMAAVLADAAALCAETGRTSQALRFFGEAIGAFEGAHGLTHPGAAALLMEQGRVAEESGEAALAASCYGKALRKAAFDTSGELLADAGARRAEDLLRQGATSEARSLLEKMLDDLRANFSVPAEKEAEQEPPQWLEYAGGERTWGRREAFQKEGIEPWPMVRVRRLIARTLEAQGEMELAARESRRAEEGAARLEERQEPATATSGRAASA